MDFRLPRGMRQYFASRSRLFTYHADSTDVNVSPDKRTIFILHEENLIEQLKVNALFCLIYDGDLNSTRIVSLDRTARK